MHLEPQKGLKTSCTLARIEFRREDNIKETLLIFGK